MLVSFSVGNFRSFGEEQTLNMVASNKLSDHPDHLVSIGDTGKSLVRSALLYGANAAGKSNLVKAMAFAQRMLTWRPQSSLSVDHFRLNPESATKPSTFEFRFLINEHVFVYGFDVTNSGIKSEWLSVLMGNNEIDIFTRDSDGHTQPLQGVRELLHDRGLTKILRQLARIPLRKNQLLLNRIGTLPRSAQGRILGGIFQWLTDDLVVVEAGHSSHAVLQRLSSDTEFRKFSGKFLSQLDTGIGDLNIQERERECSDWELEYLPRFSGDEESMDMLFGGIALRDCRLKPDDPSRVIVRSLWAQHSVSSRVYSLPFGEESDGTQQLLHYLPLLFTPKNRNRIVVIDELDRSLHPLLCWEVVNFFSESCPGNRRQLIVTTHESHLLNQELLRRDEYWFVEKDKKQQSKLVPLSDFKVRNDLQIQNGYLNGRFGAIPFVGSTEAMKRLLECETSEERYAEEEAST